jgi:hypothetical protein
MKTDIPIPKDEQIQEMKVEDLKNLIQHVNFERFVRENELPDEIDEHEFHYNEEQAARGDN